MVEPKVLSVHSPRECLTYARHSLRDENAQRHRFSGSREVKGSQPLRGEPPDLKFEGYEELAKDLGKSLCENHSCFYI